MDNINQFEDENVSPQGVETNLSPDNEIPHTTGPVPELISVLDVEKLPAEDKELVIEIYKNMWSLWQTRDVFSSRELRLIEGALNNLHEYWESQIVDIEDPLDDGAWNSACIENILDSLKKYVAGDDNFLQIKQGNSLTQETRDEILIGYATSKLQK